MMIRRYKKIHLIRIPHKGTIFSVCGNAYQAMGESDAHLTEDIKEVTCQTCLHGGRVGGRKRQDKDDE